MERIAWITGRDVAEPGHYRLAAGKCRWPSIAISRSSAAYSTGGSLMEAGGCWILLLQISVVAPPSPATGRIERLLTGFLALELETRGARRARL